MSNNDNEKQEITNSYVTIKDCKIATCIAISVILGILLFRAIEIDDKTIKIAVIVASIVLAAFNCWLNSFWEKIGSITQFLLFAISALGGSFLPFFLGGGTKKSLLELFFLGMGNTIAVGMCILYRNRESVYSKIREYLLFLPFCLFLNSVLHVFYKETSPINIFLDIVLALCNVYYTFIYILRLDTHRKSTENKKTIDKISFWGIHVIVVAIIVYALFDMNNVIG